ncbi:MAG: S-layer homology domain-containing protein [Gemmatimonadaceae bacterium]|nr:S-layer homology domain-containing protein [Gloeobacterales cyanobacterium ES-bin-141]
MNKQNIKKITAVLATSLSLGLASSLTMGSSVLAAEFSDTQSSWAANYISALSDQGVINGFPDGTFRPNQPVTRAQFAAIVDEAFNLQGGGRSPSFRDVSRNYWAFTAIQDADASGLVSGYPNGSFRPDEPVTRAQALTVLSKAVNAPQAGPAALNQYQDASQVPGWAEDSVASAAQADLIVNYPNPDRLAPNRAATRADIAAFTYQALANQGKVAALDAPTGNNRERTDRTSTRRLDLQTSSLRAGTALAATLESDYTLYISPNETKQLDLVVSGLAGERGRDGAIPYGSVVNGRFEPAQGGTRFVARNISVNGRIYPLQARSQVLRDVKDPRQTSTGSLIRDAAIGAAAGALFGGVTGDRAIATEEVLGGAAAGAVIGNVIAPRVIVVQPEQAIELTLTSDAQLR